MNQSHCKRCGDFFASGQDSTLSVQLCSLCRDTKADSWVLEQTPNFIELLLHAYRSLIQWSNLKLMLILLVFTSLAATTPVFFSSLKTLNLAVGWATGVIIILYSAFIKLLILDSMRYLRLTFVPSSNGKQAIPLRPQYFKILKILSIESIILFISFNPIVHELYMLITSESLETVILLLVAPSLLHMYLVFNITFLQNEKNQIKTLIRAALPLTKNDLKSLIQWHTTLLLSTPILAMAIGIYWLLTSNLNGLRFYIIAIAGCVCIPFLFIIIVAPALLAIQLNLRMKEQARTAMIQ